MGRVALNPDPTRGGMGRAEQCFLGVGASEGPGHVCVKGKEIALPVHAGLAHGHR